MHEHLPRRLLALILLCNSSAAWSARDYNIELIIFKYTGTEQYSAEHWPSSWPIPDMHNSLDLDKIPSKQSGQLKKLGSNAHTLNRIADSLGKSTRYQVLGHLAWRQPALNKSDAFNIKIQAGQVYRQLTPAAMPPVNEMEPASLQAGNLFVIQDNRQTGSDPITFNKATTIEYLPVASVSGLDPDKLVYELSGNIMIVISRFVHVYTDLLMMQPVTLKVEPTTNNPNKYTALDSDTLVETPKYRLIFSNPDLSFTTLHGFSIQEHRRMRSSELNFIDHPLLGIIVKAWAASE
jgi:hypothetical protein